MSENVEYFRLAPKSFNSFYRYSNENSNRNKNGRKSNLYCANFEEASFQRYNIAENVVNKCLCDVVCLEMNDRIYFE